MEHSAGHLARFGWDAEEIHVDKRITTVGCQQRRDLAPAVRF